jgi:hypothetical protein
VTLGAGLKELYEQRKTRRFEMASTQQQEPLEAEEAPLQSV